MLKKVLRLVLVTLSATCIFTGCATVAPRQSTFNEAEFAQYRGTGSSSIVGQAFLKTRAGDVKFGAGNEVVLVPVTTYTTEVFQRTIVQGQNLGVHDPRYFQYRRVTRADGTGNFEFRDIPAGNYYLSCPIFWEVPSGYVTLQTGGNAYGRVAVGRGQTAKVVLTR